MKVYRELGAVFVIVVLLLSSILIVNADESGSRKSRESGSRLYDDFSMSAEPGSGVRGEGSGCRTINEKVFDDFTMGAKNGTLLDEDGNLTLGWQPPTQPYVKDENTTLLCHFDDSLEGVDKEKSIK